MLEVSDEVHSLVMDLVAMCDGGGAAGPGAKNTPVATPLWPLGLGSWAATCSFIQVPATTPLG